MEARETVANDRDDLVCLKGAEVKQGGGGALAGEERHEALGEVERVGNADEAAAAIVCAREELVEDVLVCAALEEVVHLVEDDEDALVAVADERRELGFGDGIRLALGGVGAERLEHLGKDESRVGERHAVDKGDARDEARCGGRAGGLREAVEHRTHERRLAGSGQAADVEAGSLGVAVELDAERTCTLWRVGKEAKRLMEEELDGDALGLAAHHLDVVRSVAGSGGASDGEAGLGLCGVYTSGVSQQGSRMRVDARVLVGSSRLEHGSVDGRRDVAVRRAG